MTLWRITKFDNGPHAATAIVEADNEADALLALAAWIAHDEDRASDAGIWETKPLEGWTIDEVAGPVLFVLGAGCRE